MIGNVPKVRAKAKFVPSSSVGNIKCHHCEIRAHSPWLPFMGSFLKSQAYTSSQESPNVPSDQRQRYHSGGIFLLLLQNRSQSQQVAKAPKTCRLVGKMHRQHCQPYPTSALEPQVTPRNEYRYPEHMLAGSPYRHDRLWRAQQQLGM